MAGLYAEVACNCEANTDWELYPLRPPVAKFTKVDDPPEVAEYKKVHAERHEYRWSEWYVESRIEDEFPTYINTVKKAGFGAVVARSTPVRQVTINEARDLVHYWYEPDGRKKFEIVDTQYRSSRV